MLDSIGRAILVSTVVALFVEALLWLWRVDQGAARVQFRAASIVSGALLPILFAVVAPFRLHDWFVARFAVFAGDRWNLLDPGGIGAGRLATAVLAVAGLALLLFDLVPSLLDATGRRRPRASECRQHDDLLREARTLAAGAGMPVPAVCFIEAASPVLLCHGLAHPRLVVSAGALSLLDAAERRAALAHELVHVRHRDPLIGWGLLLVRVLCWFSPALQLQARALVTDLERRADDEAATASGDPVALASAVLRLHRHVSALSDGVGPSLWSRRLGEALRRARAAGLERRCRRLLQPVMNAPALSRGHLVAAIGASILLAFLVV